MLGACIGYGGGGGVIFGTLVAKKYVTGVTHIAVESKIVCKEQ